jgi:hypothetical protein
LSSDNGIATNQESLAHILPTSSNVDHDLAAVANAWPKLPEALKAGIVAMVKAASEG